MGLWPDAERMAAHKTPGPDMSAARWLLERGVVATGTDTETYEVQPAPDPGPTGNPQPVHTLLLIENGIYLMESLDLEALARRARPRVPLRRPAAEDPRRHRVDGRPRGRRLKGDPVPDTMQALVVLEPNRIEIREVPIPEPGPNEVLARVRAVSICGTDAHLVRGDYPGFWPPAFPFIPGHEWAGEIVALGPGAERFGWRIGDRVAGTSHDACGVCQKCVEGRYNLCENYGKAGLHQQYGHNVQGADAHVRRPRRQVRSFRSPTASRSTRARSSTRRPSRSTSPTAATSRRATPWPSPAPGRSACCPATRRGCAARRG